MRIGKVTRKTKETDIIVDLDLDGIGNVDVSTGINFLDHMIKTFATHSYIDLKLKAKGDLNHHIVEDTAICLGNAIDDALGERKGIERFGYAIVPMDDSIAFSSIDLVKRPFNKIDLKLESKSIEDLVKEDLIHFLKTFAISLQANVHIWIEYGVNDHHKAEAAIKALAISLRNAMTIGKFGNKIQSAKGKL